MTKQFVKPKNKGEALSAPSQNVLRFNESITTASNGQSVPGLQPINFTPFNAYIEQMNAVADVGEGLFNAAIKTKMMADDAEKKERDAYLANIESDDIVQTNRIFNENAMQGNDPEMLATKLGAYRDGKMSNMPEDIRPYYSQSFNKRAAVLTVKSQDDFFKKTREDAKDSLLNTQKILQEDIFTNPTPKTEIEAQAYEDKITKYRATLQARVDGGYVTPEQAQLEQRDFQKNLIVAGYKTELEKMDVNSRSKAIYALQQSKTLPAGLNINDKQDIVNQLNAYSETIESTKKKAFAEESAAAALQKSRQVADLDIKVNRGEATYEDIQRAEQNRLITPEKKAALFKILDNETEKRVGESESMQKVARTLEGKDYIDPKNTDDKKAVDFAYKKVVEPQMDAMQDPAAQKSLVTNFVQATGIVPESLRGKMRGVFRGGNVDDKVYYADLVGRIQETKPQALDDFDDKDITQAVMIDQLVKSGTPNEEAVKKVEDITNNITPGRIEALKQEFQEMQKANGSDVVSRNKKTVKHVTDLFDDGVFSRDASLPDRQLGVETAAINDYNKLYETWYLNTNGNNDIAKQQADRAFKNIWGTTAINGQSKQLTKYPIEKAYPIIDAATIKDSLVKELKTLPEYKDVSGEKVFLQYDNRTAREWGQQPSYRVLILNKDGVFEPIADPAKSRWKPDYKKLVEDKRVDAQMEAKLMREKGMSSEQVQQQKRDEASRQNLVNVGKKFGTEIKNLGDKILKVFVSDAGAAEPNLLDLQKFAAKENLSEDHVRQTMAAQNKYSREELKIIPSLIKNNYYRESFDAGTTPSAQISEKDVRQVMLNQGKKYSAKELEELPAKILQRYYEGGIK